MNKEEAELLTLELKGVQPPAPKSRSFKRLRRRTSADTQTIKIDGGSSSEGDLCLKISLPEEYHFSKVKCLLVGYFCFYYFVILSCALNAGSTK